MVGNFYRNGPARVQRASIHLQHWFDGDGMVQQFSIDNKGIYHQGQFVGTEKYLREEAAGKFLYNSTATLIPEAAAPRNNDSVNVANTALLPWRGELLALWEAGSAYCLDPQTLKSKGTKTWSSELAHMPFSAHPLREKDGSLWNFGYIPYGEQARLAIYHINKEDRVVGLGVIPLIQNGYFHAFAQTEEYLIFYISACIFTSGATYLDSFSWRPQLGSKILVVNKNTLNVPRWFEAPPGFVFHFGNAWQDGKQINLLLAAYQNADLMLTNMRTLMTGAPTQINHAQLTLAKIDLHTGSASINGSGSNLEFPNFDNQAAGATTIYGTHAHRADRSFLHDSLVAIHPEKGVLSSYYFGSHTIAEEPIIINTGKTPYLLATFYNYAKQYSGLALFNPGNLAAGPIAQAKLPYVIPLGFHGCFIAQPKAA